MKVDVTGGQGTLGVHAVRALAERGHEVQSLSRRTGFDLATGVGLNDALEGVDLVLHAASDVGRIGARDARQTSNLLDACGEITHLLYISIVGIDKIPYRYYRHKLECERIIEKSGVPYTILRATQFHELIDWVFTHLSRWPVAPLPTKAMAQPVAAAEVACRCADLLEGEPLGRAPDFAGPEVLTVPEMLKLWPERIRVVPIPTIGRVMKAFRAGLNTAPEHAEGLLTFEEYLSARQVGVRSERPGQIRVTATLRRSGAASGRK
jgi:uncharacterized protein YbjT (DUF2867 family)